MNERVDGRTGEPLPAVPDSVSIGVISANGERHVVSVIGSEAGVKALIALTEPAVPDVDIAEMIDQANAITDEDAYWVFARENFSRVLEALRVCVEAARTGAGQVNARLNAEPRVEE